GAGACGALVRCGWHHAWAAAPGRPHAGRDTPHSRGLRADAALSSPVQRRRAMDQTSAITPRERVVAAYKGQRADRVPAYPIAGSFAGCLDGLSIEEYCTNPKKAVK